MPSACMARLGQGVLEHLGLRIAWILSMERWRKPSVLWADISRGRGVSGCRAFLRTRVYFHNLPTASCGERGLCFGSLGESASRIAGGTSRCSGRVKGEVSRVGFAVSGLWQPYCACSYRQSVKCKMLSDALLNDFGIYVQAINFPPCQGGRALRFTRPACIRKR